MSAADLHNEVRYLISTEEDKCAGRYEEITAKLNAEIRELTEGGEA